MLIFSKGKYGPTKISGCNFIDSMKLTSTVLLVGYLLAGGLAAPLRAKGAPVHGWLSWRGPQQTGFSLEKNLPDRIAVKEPLWVADFPGQSTPVIANGKLYIMG